MKLFERKKLDPHTEKLIEVLTAENEALRANLDFVAVMADVEIPSDDTTEVHVDE